MAKHTPGPLFVHQQEQWPFEILIKDKDGNEVFSERRYCYSTRHESVADVMSAKGFSAKDIDAAVEANERQLADVYLRAAAPELLDALQEMIDKFSGCEATGGQLRAINEAKAAITKATGQCLKGEE